MSVEDVKQKIKDAIARGELARRQKELRLKAEAEKARKQQEEAEARKRNDAALWVANTLPMMIEQAVYDGRTCIDLEDDKYLADACEYVGLRVSARFEKKNEYFDERTVYYVHWD